MITKNGKDPAADSMRCTDVRLAARFARKNYNALSMGDLAQLKGTIRANSAKFAQDAILLNPIGYAELKGAISSVADVCRDEELAGLLRS